MVEFYYVYNTSSIRMHSEFMQRAIDLAIANVHARRGGPFAALVVRGGAILAEGTNLVTCTLDPTAHAEITAIRAACRALGTFQLTGCEIYSSCEPCPMCLGAIYWARPDRVYFAGTRQDAAAAGFGDEMIYGELAAAPEARRIPMINVMRTEARAAFDAWLRLPDRTPY